MQAFHSILRSTAATSLIAIEFESFKDQKGQSFKDRFRSNNTYLVTFSWKK